MSPWERDAAMLWAKKAIVPAEWGPTQDQFEELFVKLGSPKQMMLAAACDTKSSALSFDFLPFFFGQAHAGCHPSTAGGEPLADFLLMLVLVDFTSDLAAACPFACTA